MVKIIDYETTSDADLVKEGLLKYVNSPDFEVLCCKTKDIPCHPYLEGYDDRFRTKPTTAMIAHNAEFDGTIFRKENKDDIIWICTATLSRWLGGPSSLDQCADYWKLGSKKYSKGKMLIKWFKTNTKEHPDYEDMLKELEFYCQEDVNLTHKLFDRLMEEVEKHYTKEQFLTELAHYQDTFILNKKLLRIDINLLSDFLFFVKQKRGQAQADWDNTYDFNPRSSKQVLEWLNANGNYEVTSVNKKVLALISHELNDTQKSMLEAREALNSPIYKKLESVSNHLHNVRIAPNLIHFGTKTGRYTSYGVNILNFPHSKKVIDITLENKLKDLKGQFRRLVIVDDKYGYKKRLIQIDYKQIELRLLLYLVGHKEALDFMVKGGDIYTNFGKLIFKKEKINKNERFMAKECVLSLGYGASVTRLLIEMGDNSFKEPLEKAKILYHKYFNKVKPFWLKLSKDLYENDGVLTLPNGMKRILSLDDVGYWGKSSWANIAQKLKQQDFGKEKKSDLSLGSQLASIMCQSSVREIMTEKKHKLIKAGYNVLFDIHDEIVFEETEDKIEDIRKIMEEDLAWLPDFKLQTDLEVSKCWK